MEIKSKEETVEYLKQLVDATGLIKLEDGYFQSAIHHLSTLPDLSGEYNKFSKIRRIPHLNYDWQDAHIDFMEELKERGIITLNNISDEN